MAEPTSAKYRAEVRQRITQVHFLTFAAPPKEGNGRITEVTLKGRDDLEALAALIGTDVPALLDEIERLAAIEERIIDFLDHAGDFSQIASGQVRDLLEGEEL